MASSVQLFGSPSGIFMRALPDAEQEQEEELSYEKSSRQLVSYHDLCGIVQKQMANSTH